MNWVKWTVLAAAATIVTACGGGGDIADRLDLANPKMRFVHAIPAGPNVTLYSGDTAQGDATGVGYTYASRYFDVDTGAHTWSIRLASTPGTSLASVDVDSQRGNRDTIVALATTSGVNAMLITDPYNKGLTTDHARVRTVNAAANATAVDIYLSQASTDISLVSPDFSNVGYGQAAPGSGSDSVDVPGGTYQMRITIAGTKTIIFNAPVTIGNNADWLVLAVPTSVADIVTPNSIKVLVAQNNDSNGAAIEVTTQ